MTPEIAYLFKVNIALILFYAFYRLFFYKDTFFRLRRAVLLAFFGVALLYPFCNFQDWLKEQEPVAGMIGFYSMMVTPATPSPADIARPMSATEIARLVYLAVSAFLFIRFLAQLVSILRLKQQSKPVDFEGTVLYALKKPAGPFSFFRWIFIYLPALSEKEKREILTHELTHVRQLHSMDVMISELMSIVFWINPFVWLLKREVRHNLEYLADDKVVHSGYDCKSYQYHLLGLAHHQTTATLYNNFNVLHLKNRIRMMNQRRSKGIFRIKYLIFFPLIALLSFFSNMEAIARAANTLVKELTQTKEAVRKAEPTAGKPELPALFRILEASDLLQEKEAKDALRAVARREKTKTGDSTARSAIKNGRTAEDEPYVAVEEMPSFPGGEQALMKYIQSRLKYPKESMEKGIQGRTILRFVVEADGSIADVQVLRGLDKACDEEAVQAVQSMPRWKPGMQNGKTVPVYFTLPVVYRLQGNEKPGKNDLIAQAGNNVYIGAEQMPAFPGGERGLMEYISKNVKYPKESAQKGIQGRVIVRFVVQPDGSVSDAIVLRGLDPGCDAEAVRITRNMPKWVPGRKDGKEVPIYFTLPIQFKLS